MKVTYLTGHFPAVSQTFILNQITDMIKRGYDIEIYSWHRGDMSLAHPAVNEYQLLSKTTFCHESPKSTIPKLWESFKRIISSVTSLRFFFQLLSIRKFGWQHFMPFGRYIRGTDFLDYMKKRNPDILHIHFGGNAIIPICAKKIGQFYHTKVVVTFHGYDLNNISVGTYREVFDDVDVFTVNSNYSYRELLALGGPSDKIVRLPVGFDCAVYSPSGRPKPSTKTGVIRLLFVGRLVENKGILNALDIILELKKVFSGHIVFDVIGDGELRQKAEKYVVDLDISSEVFFYGALPQDRVISLMDRADIFLFPGITTSDGRQETQGLVVQEAQAMRLPVVVSDVGGVSEGVIDARSGYVLPEGDLDAIVLKLKMLAEDASLRSVMGKCGREYVVNKFTSERLGDVLEKIYEDLV